VAVEFRKPITAQSEYMITKLASSFRNTIMRKTEACVNHYFRFDTDVRDADADEAKENAKKANYLLETEDYLYLHHTYNAENDDRSHPFEHGFVRTVLCQTVFHSKASVGKAVPNYFRPMTIPAIAAVYICVYIAISRFAATGVHNNKMEFLGEDYRETYQGIIDTIQTFQNHPTAGLTITELRDSLYKDAMEFANIEIKAAPRKVKIRDADLEACGRQGLAAKGKAKKNTGTV